MEGRKDSKAAAQEAIMEAGVSGHIHKHPTGVYIYNKHLGEGAIERIRGGAKRISVRANGVTTKEAGKRVEEAGLGNFSSSSTSDRQAGHIADRIKSANDAATGRVHRAAVTGGRQRP